MSENRIRFYEFGPFRLDVAERQLWRDGDEITVTPKAFGVLLTLVRNHGHVVEKDTFMSEVWAESFVEEKNLTDGQSIFYNKYGYFAMGLFRRVLDQATETRVLNLPQTDSFGDWMVTGEGIYYIDRYDARGKPEDPVAIKFFDLATREAKTVVPLAHDPTSNPGLNISPDGRWFIYSIDDYRNLDIMLVENFR